jgi:thymidine phosphorylase
VLLAARMLVLARVAPDQAAADRAVRKALTSGAGLEAFRRIIERQGGDPAVIDDYSRLPAAPDQHRVVAAESGTVCEIHAELVGRAAVALGAGRATLDDVVDHGVGITVLVPLGATVAQGEALFLVRHRGGRGLEDAMALLDEAVHIGGEPCPQEPLVLDEVRLPED